MKESPADILERWQRILRRVRGELSRIDVRERSWMASGLEEIARLQVRLHDRFLKAGGPQQCGRCRGQCCDCGRNHFTLVNLLGYLLRGQSPPEPDFARPCPFLGERGCLLDVARRPFNCVTFICDDVERRMSCAGREAFYREDASLRQLYREFDRRYALSSPRGVLIRSERLGHRPYLVPGRV